MKIIKRNGAEAQFDIAKIEMAITKANLAAEEKYRMTPLQIQRITDHVLIACEQMGRSPAVEEIQDLVEKSIMAHGAFEVAKEYITYRYIRSLARQANTTDDRILSLIESNNEEVKQENANKNPTINAVQRDYMAGEVSKDITNRILLPKEIVDAHNQGIIHFHDSDYFAQHMHNCDLVNLDDMLQNGTVISGTMIEKPHSFSTACNIATQIIAQVASNQYGGQSISLTHLAPFVQVSREKIRKAVEKEMELFRINPTEDAITEVVETRLREEVRRGVQTIQYQVVTLMTTNGQAPFITVFMYLNEARSEQEKKDLAMIIEETLRQRYEGVKNEKGVWITPAFPKLIYVLEEDNVREGTPYWYLTRLAAECTAKRMVPDYISEKKMLELKGDVYVCMGCRSFLTPDRFTDAGVGNIANAGKACIGLFTVTSPDAKAKPRAVFSFNGYFDLMNSKLITFEGSKVQMVDQSTNADTYLWEVPGAQPETSTEANPTFMFPQDGDYNVKLTVTNERGKSSTSEKVSVELVRGEKAQLPIGVYNPNEDQLWTRSKVPSFATASCDWVTGANHYYKHFAERFDLPAGNEYAVTSLTLYLCYYNLASRCYNEQANEPVSIVLYGEKDGKPDTSKEFGRYTSTMKGLFGTLRISEAEMLGILFDKPIVADGPFYVAFEFSDGLWFDEPDANVSRTEVGFGGFTHRSKVTTLYVQPTAVPETSTFVPDGSYCPVDALDAEYKGLGLNLVAWANVKGSETSVALTSDGSVAFDARLDGDLLTVSGTHAGETVLVSDVAGKTVATAKASAESTALSLSNVPAGLYIVKTDLGARKFVKK